VFDHQFALKLLELLDLGIIHVAELDEDIAETPLWIATLFAGRHLELLHGDHFALDREATNQGYGLFCAHCAWLSASREAALSQRHGNLVFARDASFAAQAKPLNSRSGLPGNHLKPALTC
jgi:hypothetical protein